MVGVLFVCLGNICRSTMAEAVMRHLVKEAHLAEQIRVDSAGTSNYHIGESPHTGTQNKLREMGIPFEGIVSRKITKRDLSTFQYVIAMDEENLSDLHRMSRAEQGGNIHLLSDFAEEGVFSADRSVPDPWFTGDFQETFDLVGQGCKGLLDHIRAQDL